MSTLTVIPDAVIPANAGISLVELVETLAISPEFVIPANAGISGAESQAEIPGRARDDVATRGDLQARHDVRTRVSTSSTSGLGSTSGVSTSSTSGRVSTSAQLTMEAEWGCTPSGCGRALGNSAAELAEPVRLPWAGRGASPLRGNRLKHAVGNGRVSTSSTSGLRSTNGEEL